MMEKIAYNNTVIAIRIKSFKNGSVPLTDPNEPLQLVTLKHAKNTYLKPHIHIPKKRMTQKLQECIIVRKGRLKIDLYTTTKKFFKYIYLDAGEALMLVNGGYGIHVLKDSEMIELKNGPFVEDKVLIES